MIRSSFRRNSSLAPRSKSPEKLSRTLLGGRGYSSGRFLSPLSLLLALFVLSPREALPQPKVEFAVVPTESEWIGFPPYCKARYSVSLNARGTPFEGRVPAAEIARWHQQLGTIWDRIHHYCYGLLQLSRGQQLTDPTKRNYVLHNAVSEFDFSYRAFRGDPKTRTNPFTALAAIHLGLTYKAQGNLKEALRYVDEAIQIDPKLETAYGAKAVMQRQEGALDKAVETLQKGIASVDGDSAELNYFLGLTYFDLNEFDLAKQYSDKAYALGYPLPGLRNKLLRSGH